MLDVVVVANHEHQPPQATHVQGPSMECKDLLTLKGGWGYHLLGLSPGAFYQLHISPLAAVGPKRLP